MSRGVLLVAVLSLAALSVLLVPADRAGDAARIAEIQLLLDEGRAADAIAVGRALLAAVESRHGREALETARALDLLVEALRTARHTGWSETLDLAERSVAIKRRALPQGSPELAESLAALAGVLSSRKSERRRALELFDEAEKALSAAPGENDPVLAEILAGRGYLLQLMNRAEEAKPVLERSVAIREEAFGREHRETARGLHLLSYAHDGLRDHETAQRVAEEALAIRESLLRPDHPEIGDSLSAVSAFRLRLGKSAGLTPMLERALAIRERSFGAEHPATLDVLWNLALQLSNEGQAERSESLHLELISIFEKKGGPKHPKLQGVLRNLGGLYNRTGRLEDARDAFRRALFVAEANDVADSALGRELHNLALVLKPLGQLDEARRMFERSLSLVEKSDGPESRAVALVLHSFGNLKLDLGEFTSARAMFERSLAIREARFGHDHPVIAHSVVGVAESLWSLGDRGAAKSWLERAARIYERLDPPSPRNQGYVLAQLGRLLGELGDFDGAERHLDRALELRTREGETVQRGLTYEAYGELRARQGDHEAAIERFSRSLDAREENGEHDHPDTATTLVRLAGSLEDVGRHEEARRHVERALAIRRASFGSSHPEVRRAQVQLARIDRTLGRDDDAFDAAIEGHLGGLEHVTLTIRALSERRALAFADEAPSGLDLALSIAIEEPTEQRTDRVWGAVARTRAVVLDEMARRVRASVGAEDAETTALRRELAHARERLANLLVVGPGDDPRGRYARILARARRESEEAERALAEKSAPFAEDMKTERRSWREIVERLPPGGAIVSYVLFDRQDHVETNETGDYARLTSIPSYAAIIARPDGSPAKLVDMGPASEIERLVRVWRDAVATEPPKIKQAARRAELSYSSAGEKLREAIWDPVARELGEDRRVFIVPDGDLHFVSFATLPAGADRYLVETGPTLHLLSSERDLLQRPRPEGEPLDLLAVGAPDYDADPGAVDLGALAGASERMARLASEAKRPSTHRGSSASCETFRKRRFSALPAAATEVSEIVRLWRSASSGSLGRPPEAIALTGAQASEGLFKRLAPRHGVLHFATHGFFLGDDCSSRATSGSDGRRGGPAVAAAMSESPLHLSGLAFAGGNRRADAGEGREDGVLTAEEIASLDLHAAAWVVLSGCDTGLGAIRPREGVLGLRRAFRTAGAGSLIMSLWAVEDTAAREWMERLYRGRTNGLSTAGAVRGASVDVIEARREAGRSTHPFYWGAFVASGDWR